MKFNLAYLTLAVASLYSAQDISDNDANAALDAICKNQKILNGCSLRSMCAANKNLSSAYCSPVAVLATVCTTDAKTDTNCNSYNSACVPGADKTPAKQCTTSQPFPSMPSTKNLTNLLINGCNEMPQMEDCNVVKGAGSDGLLPVDNLSVYGAFCLSMPEMTQCKTWKSICSASSDFDPICKTPKYDANSGSSSGGNSGSSTGTSSSGGSTPSSKPSSDIKSVQFGIFGAAAMMVSSAVLLVL